MVPSINFSIIQNEFLKFSYNFWSSQHPSPMSIRVFCESYQTFSSFNTFVGPFIELIKCNFDASLAFLQRNLRACSHHIKKHCCKTSVRPIIEYAASIWAPHTTQDIKRLICFREEQPVLFAIITTETRVSLIYLILLAGHH